MVSRRSRSPPSVRAAMTAGVVQPKPISMGMKDLPVSPSRRRGRSIRKAARER